MWQLAQLLFSRRKSLSDRCIRILERLRETRTSWRLRTLIES
jgi:hypothetical protein